MHLAGYHGDRAAAPTLLRRAYLVLDHAGSLALIPCRIAYRDKRRERGRLKAKVEPMLT